MGRGPFGANGGGGMSHGEGGNQPIDKTAEPFVISNLPLRIIVLYIFSQYLDICKNITDFYSCLYVDKPCTGYVLYNKRYCDMHWRNRAMPIMFVFYCHHVYAMAIVVRSSMSFPYRNLALAIVTKSL